MNDNMEKLSATERVEHALANLPGNPVLSSSFGVQSAVSLHLITQVQPGIPVVVIDTGYLFPETYAFIDELTERLDLNLKVYEPGRSAAWREARHGRQWERGVAGITEYNRIAKVEPMQRALDELDAGNMPEPVAQNDKLATYASKLNKAEAKLDWQLAAAILERRVRAFNPWPVCWSELDGQRLRIWRAKAISAATGSPVGTVASAGPEGIDVSTSDGFLRLLEVQAAGGRRTGRGAVCLPWPSGSMRQPELLRTRCLGRVRRRTERAGPRLPELTAGHGGV